jgi:Tol biopolymer transport system component
MERRIVISITLGLLALASVAYGKEYGAWGDPVNAESISGTDPQLNTQYNDGCPIQSPDGLSLYIASNRQGTLGGQDIWVAHRDAVGDPYGAPEQLPAPVNSTANDFCPSPTRGRRLFFVSERAGGCGGADIYVTRLDKDGWRDPVNLGCAINSTAGEASPSFFTDDAGRSILYFSSSRAGGFSPGGTDSDVYFSVDFGAAQLAPGLNTASEDSRPNVRKDGLEVVFDSTRTGGLSALPDIWTAQRPNDLATWTSPVHLPSPINTEASESRASLSWDGLTMVFGSTRSDSEPDPGGGPTMADVYITTRTG